MIINFESLGGGGGNPSLVKSGFTSVVFNQSASTLDFYNVNGDVVEQLDASAFIIDGMVEDVYLSGNTLVIDFNTESGQQDIEIDLTDFINPDLYYTSAQTDTLILNAKNDVYASATTYTDGEISALTAHLEDVEQVTASALTELHTDIVYLSGATANFVTSGDVATQISTATSHMVESEDDSVVNIIRISQAEYDALVSKDPYTLYVIAIAPTYIGEWEDVLGDHTQYHFTILDDTSSLWNDVKIGTIHCWYLPEGQGSASVVEGDVDIHLNYAQSSWNLRFTDNNTFDDTIELYDSVGLYESNISVVEVSDPNDTNWKPLGLDMNNAIIYFSGLGSPISLVTINPTE